RSKGELICGGRRSTNNVFRRLCDPSDARPSDRCRRSICHDSRVSRFRIGALLFLSGTAALIYQLLWIKQLSLIVGVDVYAVTTAVSAFFGGLAVGSAIF